MAARDVQKTWIPLTMASQRHRTVFGEGVTVLTERPAFRDEASDAADLIAILADALERIIEAGTTDTHARTIAAEAMAEFWGR